MPCIICLADNAHAVLCVVCKNTRYCPVCLVDYIKRMDCVSCPTCNVQIYPVPRPVSRRVSPDTWGAAPLHNQITTQTAQAAQSVQARRINPPVDILREMGRMRARNFTFPPHAPDPAVLLTHADEFINQGAYTSALELYNTAAIHFSYAGNREMQRRAEQMAETCRIHISEEI